MTTAMRSYYSLSAFEQWMARSNLARIGSSPGMGTTEQVVDRLRANGYPRIAHAVEEEAQLLKLP